jgi:hypothetical protein
MSQPNLADLPPVSGAYQRNPERPFETLPYRAVNGHRMIAPIADMGRVSESGAWCADGCAACGGGDQRPDW